MAQILLKGNPINTCGTLPAVGSQAPAFTVTGIDLADMKLTDFSGKRVVLNIFPSIDTPVCASSVRRFNVEAAKLANTVVLCVSMDLPFAHKRFCGAEGIENVKSVSGIRSNGFGKAYGIEIIDGPLAALYGRAIVIIDASGIVTYTELVPEVTQEPDYDAAIAAMQ
ncbi:thiol peroxidase [Chrysiogenes arsenatis]|uniref:thiol peroxidase n=1 Tax=Chrysiogenes arsenatis TaxID=309797 RepID=UPI00042716D2|nr:thiol peroxidase [Chrysiogenes arsenatis]